MTDTVGRRRGPLRPSFSLSRAYPIPIVCAAALAVAAAPPATGRPDARQLDPRRDSLLASVAASALGSEHVLPWALGLIDSIGGRLSGTPSGARSEAWAATQLRALGFDTVWLETVPLRTWERGPARATVVEPKPLAGRAIAIAAWGYSPGAHLAGARVVDLGRGDPGVLQDLGEAARGAILLCDAVPQALIGAAATAGAAAILRISPDPGRLVQARVAPVDKPPAPLPVLATSLEDGLWIRRQLAYGHLSLQLNVETTLGEGVANNVVGEWLGRSEPKEVVLLGAHLDAWDLGAGAIDNGSGVLATLEAARSVVGTGQRPRRTLRVVFFAAEELGLLGSRAYVARHAPSLRRIAAMVNLDMVGWPEGYGATGHPEGDALLRALTRLLPLDSLGLSAEVHHGGGPGSDHQPFLLAGVPTLYVRTSLPPESVRWYHNAGDTLDKLDLDAVRRTAAAAAVVVWALADEKDRVYRHLDEAQTRELVKQLAWF